ncbi:MAG: hypothetical protein VW982_07050 [Candidatus Poseidoniales archaeon]|jgi:hypothetical protein
MSACPRAWAITYATKPTGVITERKPVPSAPRTFDELLLRAMRRNWLNRLNDQYQRKVWTKPYAQRMMRKTAEDAMDHTNMSVPSLHYEMGIQQATHQVLSLERTPVLRPLFSGQPRRWAFFERRQSTLVDDIELFAAPDVAIFHQHQWTLVRLQFRSSPHASLGQQLEHLLMVHWAMNQPGFPDHAEAYRVRIVRWHGQRWHEHTVRISPDLLKQASALVKHDVQEMTWLQRWSNADPSYNSLPLATHHDRCRPCTFREGCPAKHGLKAAKDAQERSMLEGIYSEATKSAKTA